MQLDDDTCYRALVARDVRFDGRFFVGVSSTGIYCRPVCRARTPARANCSFFERAVEAERAGYRPCLRCRPELAPGASRTDATSRLLDAILKKVEAGFLNGRGVEDLASELGITGRHLRRTVSKELGLTPLHLARSRRLAVAKQLLQDSDLPIIDVAYASGFSSVRRFNSAFHDQMGRSPSSVRDRRAGARSDDAITLRLDYRPPLDWNALLRFLDARAVENVESVVGSSFVRTVRIGTHAGWIQVAPVGGRPSLRVTASSALRSALFPLVAGVRALFDLDAHPAEIDSHLAHDGMLAQQICRHPGIRVPGCLDGFELAVRAILGQAVSVRWSTKLAGRLTEVLGEPVVTPFAGAKRLFPQVESVASCELYVLTRLGIPEARARALRLLAVAVTQGSVRLERRPAALEPVLDELAAIPGIGPWTANYVAMRALGWPDAFLPADAAVQRVFPALTATEIERISERWRPWRAYALMHLWLGCQEGFADYRRALG